MEHIGRKCMLLIPLKKELGIFVSYLSKKPQIINCEYRRVRIIG